MPTSRVFLIMMLWLLLLAGMIAWQSVHPWPLLAQCDPASENCSPLSTRPECPSGSHPVGLRDCEVDGSSGLTGFSLSGAGADVSILADFSFTGSEISVSGILQDSTSPVFDRLTADPVAQICGGDSASDGINYRAYSLLNTTNQAQTIEIRLTTVSGILQPFLQLYHQSFSASDPATNCLKAAEGTSGTASIRRFTWQPGQQVVVVLTGFSSSSDEGNYNLTITPSGSESESNNTAASARPFSPNLDWLKAEISPVGDEDYYRFEAKANQRVWIYVRTDQSPASRDSRVELRTGSDILVTFDTNNGGQNGSSSAIAGFDLTASGTYLVRVTEQGDDATLTPYFLYVYLSDQDPVNENEGNNSPGAATPYDQSGSTYQLAPQIFRGYQGDAGNGIDFFKLTTPPGALIFTSVDTDPDNNSTDFNGTLQLYNSGGTSVVTVDSGETFPRSETLSYGQAASESTTGATTWYASVISNSAGVNLEYHLLVGYSPVKQGDVTFSTDVGGTGGKIIPDDGTAITSTLISGYYCMDNLDVWLDLDHDNLDDLEVSLKSPEGTTATLFAGRGGDDDSLNLTLDDEGGLDFLPDDGIDAVSARLGGRYQTDDTILDNFYTQSGIGRWVLTVTDTTPGNNNLATTDALNNWALIMHCDDINLIYLPIIFKDN